VKRLWVWLCRFAYRRAITGRSRTPVGLPGNRDPEFRCLQYDPRRKRGEHGDCDTDGHYLCVGCTHISEYALAERGIDSLNNPLKVRQ
jgi:hypothetical protein